MNKRKIYLWLFAILYCCVAFVSTFHAISFFSLANSLFLAIILAVSFEIGQAAVLFNLLTSKKKGRFMPWVLMGTFTLVQVLGNVFSSYKYLMINSADDLIYFKNPIFTWTALPDTQCNVILSYIIGAILPICSLLLTEMVTESLNEETDSKNEVIDDIIEQSDTNEETINSILNSQSNSDHVKPDTSGFVNI